MKPSIPEAWLLLRKMFDDGKIVLASVVLEGEAVASVLGTVVRCDEERCEIFGDGLNGVSFARHAITDAEFTDPRDTPLEVLGNRLQGEGFESTLRLALRPNAFVFIIQTMESQTDDG